MANYKEGTPSGIPWHRFPRLIIENPLYMPELNEIGTRSIVIVEEEVIPLTDRAIKSQCSGLSCSFDPSASFAILNPVTDEPTGASMTHAELYAVLYSLTMNLAVIRDTPPVVEPVIEEPIV